MHRLELFWIAAVVSLGIGCGEDEFTKFEKEACACKERECNRALWDKVPNLLIKAMGADDPKKAAEAVQRGSECIDKFKAAGG